MYWSVVTALRANKELQGCLAVVGCWHREALSEPDAMLTHSGRNSLAAASHSVLSPEEGKGLLRRSMCGRLSVCGYEYKIESARRLKLPFLSVLV